MSVFIKGNDMNQDQVNELLLQSLEHEKGGIDVYKAALECVINEDLREEWQKYLQETYHHERILTQLCETMGLDPTQETSGRGAMKLVSTALVWAMRKALVRGTPEAAELVACECVVLAETKHHLDWELIGRCANQLKGDNAKALKAAHQEVEDQEDEHLHHATGWCRELWMASLGMKANLPPPEVSHHFTTLVGAVRAGQLNDVLR